MEQHSAANEQLINNWLTPPAFHNILKYYLSVAYVPLFPRRGF